VKTSIVLSAILCSFVSAFAQRPVPPGIRQADRTLEQSERNVPPPLYRRSPTDLAKLRHDADELASLAQSIPPGVDETTKGVLPKDLADKLKRIEKLAKQLRLQISQ
jgi:hypothetical protein